jgi:hypothetical protein
MLLSPVELPVELTAASSRDEKFHTTCELPAELFVLLLVVAMPLALQPARQQEREVEKDPT